jgi:hypothetical protein
MKPAARLRVASSALVLAAAVASTCLAQPAPTLVPAPAPAPVAAPVAEPAPPKGLEPLLGFSCAALEKLQAEHVAAGRYYKPDANNAILVTGALELKDCKYAKVGAVNRSLQAGVVVTNEFIGESVRYAEYCSLFEIAEFVPDPNGNIANLASFRASYCSPPPASTWTDADTRLVQERAQRMPELDQLKARFDAAWLARHFDTPVGENVVEITLAGRDRGFGKIREYYIGVIPQLLPGLVASASRELAAGNRAEFERLMALIVRADPQHPEVERLRRAAAAVTPR